MEGTLLAMLEACLRPASVPLTVVCVGSAPVTWWLQLQSIGTVPGWSRCNPDMMCGNLFQSDAAGWLFEACVCSLEWWQLLQQ
jgi:hypothetical protein